MIEGRSGELALGRAMQLYFFRDKTMQVSFESGDSRCELVWAILKP